MGKLLRAGARGAALLAAVAALDGQQPTPGQPDDFHFKSGVELVNVTATVSDANGRFVSGLRQDDFIVYEDDQPQRVAQFSAERAPVSLGVALDTSGSMAGDKIEEARSALNRFLYDLLDPKDEIFLYRFSDRPVLLQGWTSDRRALAGALGHITPNGGTAMYDTVADAIPLAAQGAHQKKALLVISDGNDTSSHTELSQLRPLIRESEVLVYAIGIDAEAPAVPYSPRPQQPPPRLPPLGRPPIPIPFPFPGRRPPGRGFMRTSQIGQGGWSRNSPAGDRVNVVALRDLTDESGGRTEIVRDARDLDPATANIADELSRQYYLGYTSSGKKDGRWHAIRVEVRSGSYRVRARRGYIAN